MTNIYTNSNDIKQNMTETKWPKQTDEQMHTQSSNPKLLIWLEITYTEV